MRKVRCHTDRGWKHCTSSPPSIHHPQTTLYLPSKPPQSCDSLLPSFLDFLLFSFRVLFSTPLPYFSLLYPFYSYSSSPPPTLILQPYHSHFSESYKRTYHFLPLCPTLKQYFVMKLQTCKTHTLINTLETFNKCN